MDIVKHRTITRLDDRAAAALLCGAVGLFLFNAVLGPFAIALGAVAARRARRAGGSGRLGYAAALLGIGLGVADLVVLAVLVASRIHDGTLHVNG
ncbi:hypothetical protein HC031_22760 [Planosporangium thailandense]|uniref:DUF4190 domain-containing protein n=1 Tax=Planosporangium thailandense TaxID=765197 RepID=A0ABX0Y317_9ACTN|nr:hypothetical protein [Planosporangium thailandense]NJC72517.1 hypothetical protein [Planosporangium thailandense]